MYKKGTPEYDTWIASPKGQAWLAKQADAAHRRAEDPNWRKNVSDANRVKASDPEWQRKNAIGVEKRKNDPNWRRNVSDANRRKAKDPDWWNRVADAALKKAQQLENQGKTHSPKRVAAKVRKELEKRSQERKRGNEPTYYTPSKSG